MKNKKIRECLISLFPLENRQATKEIALFAWLTSHQPTVLFSQKKSATINQPAVLFSQNKSAPAISHQPNEQADGPACQPTERTSAEERNPRSTPSN
jgi:hypothetical protein